MIEVPLLTVYTGVSCSPSLSELDTKPPLIYFSTNDFQDRQTSPRFTVAYAFFASPLGVRLFISTNVSSINTNDDGSVKYVGDVTLGFLQFSDSPSCTL